MEGKSGVGAVRGGTRRGSKEMQKEIEIRAISFTFATVPVLYNP